ncbi:MAG: zinc-dependent alcohol dehydrogenase [Candidatus Bathyarchaeia archaeon]
MRAVLCNGPESIVIGEVPEPRVAAHEVIVEPLYGSICGSDIAICQFHGKKYPGIDPSPENPIVIGHEWSGVYDGRLVSSGCTLGCYGQAIYPPCPNCTVGREDQCYNRKRIGFEVQGAFSERIAFPLNLLFNVPEGLDAKVASQTEPLSVAVNAVKYLGEVDGGKSVLVWGAGPIGLYVMQYARVMGSTRIFVVDIADYRLRLAEKLGASRTFNPYREDPVSLIMEETGGLGVDVAFECTGYPPAFNRVLEASRRMATVVIVSIYGERLVVEHPFRDMIDKGLTIKNARLGPADSVRLALKSLADGSVKPVITHEFKMDEAEKAFRVAADPDRYESVKVVIRLG